MNTSRINSPWVLIEIDDVIYAVSCESVLSLNQVPDITPLPVAPKEVRGVIDFRTKLIQLLDARILLGLKSVATELVEFAQMMDQRYQDHLNWIQTLEKNVRENTEFTLTTDPHKCAFGKWYDNYKPKNTNITFLSVFAKFDKPHKEIHKIGITADDLVKAGKKDEAIALIESVRNTELKQMPGLFTELKRAYEESRRETVVVLGDEKHCVGLSVDQITAIEHLFELDEEFIKESLTNTEYLSGVAKREDGSVVLLLNDEYIISKYKYHQ